MSWGHIFGGLPTYAKSEAGGECGHIVHGLSLHLVHDNFTGLTRSSSTDGGLFKQILGNNKENFSYIVLGFLCKDLGKMQRGLCSEKLPLTTSCLLEKGIW